MSSLMKARAFAAAAATAVAVFVAGCGGDAGGSGGTFNHYNRKLLELAEQNNIPISRKEKENSL